MTWGRTVFGLFIVFLVASCGSLLRAAPKQPITTPNGWVCRTKQQDAELRDWIAGIQKQADKAISDAQAARKSESEVRVNLKLASDDGIKLAQERDKAILDLNHVLKKLHFDKWLISALAAAAVVFGLLNLPIPMPYKLYALVAGPGIATAAVWMFL